MVGALGFDEVLVSTYSGWISGLTTEHMQKTVTGSTAPTSVDGTNSTPSNVDEDTQKKLTGLRWVFAYFEC